MTEKGKRIGKVINYFGLNKNSFSKEIGMTSNVTIGRILNEDRNPHPSTLQKIVDRFHEIDYNWLLTGEGEMLKEEESQAPETAEMSRGKVIPYYDVEAVAGNGSMVDMSPVSHPVGMIEIGGLLKDSESALRVYGNCLTPIYPPGSVIGMRKHYDSFIEPGCVYVIETRDNRYLKRLYYNKEKTAFRCISDNHMVHESGSMKGELCFPEFEIPLDEVTRLFRVTGVIKRNTI